MQVPRPGIRALQPIGIDVIGRKARVAFAGINELPDGPAVGVILGAAGGALVQIWNQALARKPGSAVRVYQPEPDWQGEPFGQQGEYRVGRAAEPHRQQVVAACSGGSQAGRCWNLGIINRQALDEWSESADDLFQ